MKNWFTEFQMSRPETNIANQEKMDFFFAKRCKKEGYLAHKREERKNEYYRKHNCYGRN